MNSAERRCPKCSDTGLTRADSAGLGFCFCDIGLDRYLAALHIALADVEADLSGCAVTALHIYPQPDVDISGEPFTHVCRRCMATTAGLEDENETYCAYPAEPHDWAPAYPEAAL